MMRELCIKIDGLLDSFGALLTFSFLNISATMLSAVARELPFMALPLRRFSGSVKEAHTEETELG